MTAAGDAVSADSENIIAFAPRPKPAPELNFAEFTLDGDGLCGLQLTLCDETGSVVAVLEYKLTDCTPGFDLDRLRRKWTEDWRGTSTTAS